MSKKGTSKSAINDKILSQDILKEMEKKIQQLSVANNKSNTPNTKMINQKKAETDQLIGYYSEQYAKLFGSSIWLNMNDKEIYVTEVCKIGITPFSLQCGVRPVGPVKKFVKRLCPLELDKESNCLCKCNAPVYLSTMTSES